MRSDKPDVTGKANFRTTLRAAIRPTGLYLLVAAPLTALSYATADVHGLVPGPVLCLSGLGGLFELYLTGWAGYRAMQWTRRRRWALLAGLLVAAVGEGLLLLATAALSVARSAGLGGGLDASNLAAPLVPNASGLGLDCLIAVLVGWFGSLVTFKQASAQALQVRAPLDEP